MKHPQGTLFEKLPKIATAVFCAATVWVLFHDLLPAFRETQRAESLYEYQLSRYQALVEDLENKRDAIWSLQNDPQERERILVQRGMSLTPPGNTAGAEQDAHEPTR